MQDAARRNEFVARWMSLDQGVRTHVKNIAMSALGADKLPPARAAAIVVSKIALIELGENMWPELIPSLLHSTTLPNVIARITAQETLGYICDDIVRIMSCYVVSNSNIMQDPDVLGEQSNNILSAVIQGMRKEEQDLSVRYIIL